MSMLATVGQARVQVYRRPAVAISSTGDELVEVAGKPLDHQIRNSNGYSLAAQVRRAGGAAGNSAGARDKQDATRRLIERGWRRICCSSRAASRRASTMWWR